MELDKEGFRKWLKREDKPLEEIIGISSSSMSCPIALYLLESTPMGRPLICDTHFRDMANRCWETYSTPSWAKEFIQKIDGLGFERSISREKALEVLDSITIS